MRSSHVIKTDQGRSDTQIRSAAHFAILSAIRPILFLPPAQYRQIHSISVAIITPTCRFWLMRTIRVNYPFILYGLSNTLSKTHSYLAYTLTTQQHAKASLVTVFDSDFTSYIFATTTPYAGMLSCS